MSIFLANMGAVERVSAPGQFVHLPQGTTHFTWHGPKDGPLLVLVHGLTTPSFVWRDVLDDFTAAGYRVLTYDLFGRGFSDRPKGKQDASFFVTQLRDLLHALDINQSFNLLGYSMGGGIVTCFSADHPEKVRKLILVASAGFRTDLGPYFQLTKIPILGDIISALTSGSIIRKGSISTGDSEGVDQAMVDLQCRETRFKGFTSAVHSSCKNFLHHDFRRRHETLAKQQIPMLAIWGDADTVIPIEGSTTLAAINPKVETVVLKGAGHSLVFTRSAEFAASVTDFLNR